jgi:hypothetical protein
MEVNTYDESYYYDILAESGYPEEKTSLLIDTLMLCQDFPFEHAQIILNLEKLFNDYGVVMFNPDTGELHIGTGGWYDNETVIGLLEQTFWWVLYWQTSNRGGEYIFQITEDQR